jgi:hypothetical protein
MLISYFELSNINWLKYKFAYCFKYNNQIVEISFA